MRPDPGAVRFQDHRKLQSWVYLTQVLVCAYEVGGGGGYVKLLSQFKQLPLVR